MERAHPRNRLVAHLVRCCVEYRCPAARNYFLGRWEAPLPTSPACNARCLGCLSLQPPESCCPATQERIGFAPTVTELLEIAVPHLERAPRAVASFGQGCEGEPLLQAPLIEEAVRAIRARTARGTLNLNTNASRPEALVRLLDAGLDSVRVSLNSARPALYRAYARPRGYGFEDVVRSMREVRRRGKFLSLNYFVFPGATDDPAEWAAFRALLREVRPDLIQWRNLNLDPEWYWGIARPLQGGAPLGVARILARVRREFPRVRFGYYNPPLRGPRAYAAAPTAGRAR
jgi:MoaA/NifB/PqqE/SkfB family radical SAM enzyme